MQIVECKKPCEKLEELWPLLEKHWDELTTVKDLMIPKPNMEQYKAHEAAGSLMVFFLMDGEKIVGYSVSFLYHPMHWADLLVCHNDLLFVDPEYRNTTWSARMIIKTEVEAKKRGAPLMFWHGKPGTPFAKLMDAHAGGIQDIVYWVRT